MNFNKRVIIKILCFSFLFNVVSTYGSFGMECWKSIQKTVDSTIKTLGDEGVKVTKTVGVLGIAGGIAGGVFALICDKMLGNGDSAFAETTMGAAACTVFAGAGCLVLSKTLKWCFGQKPNYEKERNKIEKDRFELERKKFEWEKGYGSSSDEESSDSSSDSDSSDEEE